MQTNNVLNNGYPLYKYKWQVQLCHSNIDSNNEEYVESFVSNIRVLPESEKDLYPLLTQKYIFRPVFRKVKVYFNILNDKYCAIWFMDETKLIGFFKRLFGNHNDTNTDIIIEINYLCQNYKLCLFRHGLKEPVMIPESTYELIVFKNKFEYYRSENYNQPRGAWIW